MNFVMKQFEDMHLLYVGYKSHQTNSEIKNLHTIWSSEVAL